MHWVGWQAVLAVVHLPRLVRRILLHARPTSQRHIRIAFVELPTRVVQFDCGRPIPRLLLDFRLSGTHRRWRVLLLLIPRHRSSPGVFGKLKSQVVKRNPLRNHHRISMTIGIIFLHHAELKKVEEGNNSERVVPNDRPRQYRHFNSPWELLTRHSSSC